MMLPMTGLLVATSFVFAYTPNSIDITHSARYSESIDKILQYKLPCSQQALYEILPTCESKGSDQLDPVLTRLAAAKLAICEFESSHILYPSSCLLVEDDLDLCILDLEKSPQFWTTFSGYYREISRICHEASVPFQKSHIVDLYSNITIIYEELLQDYQNSQKFNHETQIRFEQKFDEIMQYLNSSFRNYQQQNDATYKQYDEYYQNMQSAQENGLKSMAQAYDTLQTNFSNIGNQMVDIHQYFEYLQTLMANLQVDAEIDKLKSSYLQEFTNITDTSSQLLSHILQQMEGIDIVTVKNSENLLLLNANLNETNILANEVSLSLKDCRDLLHNQLYSISQFADEFFTNYSAMIQLSMDEYLIETFYKVEIMLNHTIQELETRVNETTTQLDHINRNINGFKITFGYITTFANATYFAIKSAPINLIEILLKPVKSLKTITSTFLKDLFYIPQVIIIAILVTLSSIYLWKISTYIELIGFKSIIQYLSFMMFLFLGILSAFIVKNIFIAFQNLQY